MKLTDEARAKRKAQQLARLEKKGTPEYPELYAAQPDQLRIDAQQKAARAAQRAAKNAAVEQVSSDAAGAVQVFAGGTAQIESTSSASVTE